MTAEHEATGGTAGGHPVGRRSLMGMAGLVAGSGVAIGSGLIPGTTAPAEAVEPPPRAVPAGAQGPGPVDGSTVTRVGNISGPGVTTQFDLERVDVGIPRSTPDGRTLVTFGDSYASWIGDTPQMSPTGLYAPADQPADEVLHFTEAVGGEKAREMLPPYRPDGEFSTKIPSDVITVGDTMYMQVWAVNPWPDVKRIEVWSSTDQGQSWELTNATWPGDVEAGQFGLWTWDLHEDGFVYLCTSRYRDSPLFMWRVPAESIGEADAYEPWGWTEADGWQWGHAPTPILDQLPPPPGGKVETFGEMSLRRIDDKWLFVTGTPAGLSAYLLDEPWSDLQATEPLTLLTPAAPGEETVTSVASLYVGGIMPGSTLKDFTVLISQWVQDTSHTEAGWPYWVEQFRFQDVF